MEITYKGTVGGIREGFSSLAVCILFHLFVFLPQNTF